MLVRERLHTPPTITPPTRADLDAELLMPALVRYLSEQLAARYLGSSTRTLARMREHGGGPPFVRVGDRRIVYDRFAVDAWMRGRTFHSNAEELARAAAE